MMDLKSMTPDELKSLAVSIGEKPFRGRQIFSWISRGVCDFSEMTDLSLKLRTALSDKCELSPRCVVSRQISAKDGTRKYLIKLDDGCAVETVFMKYKYGNSVCLSSQAGCSMGCKFCASGLLGLERNLTAGEMLDQVLAAASDTGETISHLVIMGTGEPFDNYYNVARFMRIVHDPAGFNMSMRNITVSTCGLIPGMKKFAGDFPQATLAVSLHGASDDVRSRLMPVNRRYPLNDLMDAARDYCKCTGRRITFEYSLIHGVNDSMKDGDMLAARLKGILCHVNLIPLNRVDETGLVTSGRETAVKFMERLESKGVNATIRRELGSDISAACGQLRLQEGKREDNSK